MVKRVVAETGFSFSFIVYAVRKGKIGSEEGKNRTEQNSEGGGGIRITRESTIQYNAI